MASPVAPALSILCTSLNNISVMTKRNAHQCSACVQIKRKRALLSWARRHPAAIQTKAITGASSSQYPRIGFFV